MKPSTAQAIFAILWLVAGTHSLYIAHDLDLWRWEGTMAMLSMILAQVLAVLERGNG